MRITSHLLSRSVCLHAKLLQCSLLLIHVKTVVYRLCRIDGSCAVGRKNAAVYDTRELHDCAAALWTSAFTHVVSFTCRQSDKTCRCLRSVVRLSAGIRRRLQRSSRLCSLPGIQPASPYDLCRLLHHRQSSNRC